MINISHKAWYVQYYMSMNNQYPDNLCQFIRGLFVATFIWLFIIALLCAILTVLLYPLAYAFSFAKDGFIMGVGMLFNGAIAIYVLRNMPTKWQKGFWFKDVIPEIETNIETPAFIVILGHWMKALHDKTCPLIKIQ